MPAVYHGHLRLGDGKQEHLGQHLDFDAGEVATVADIRQPTVREFFNRILQDEAQMNVWRAESPGASDLEILRANLAP